MNILGERATPSSEFIWVWCWVLGWQMALAVGYWKGGWVLATIFVVATFATLIACVVWRSILVVPLVVVPVGAMLLVDYYRSKTTPPPLPASFTYEEAHNAPPKWEDLSETPPRFSLEVETPHGWKTFDSYATVGECEGIGRDRAKARLVMRNHGCIRRESAPDE
jgi:hypothetical protein